MKLESIADHTVDVDRLCGGWVLDAGCRNFHFSKEMVARGCRVIALDADPTVENPHIEGVTFVNFAIADVAGQIDFAMHTNPEARGVPHHNTSADVPRVMVEARRIEQIGTLFGVTHWDLVKLDVEGAEYKILKTWPGPIADQVSIEFHEHCVGRQAPDVYDRVFTCIRDWYDVVQHARTERYCAGPNFWDTLLVRR